MMANDSRQVGNHFVDLAQRNNRPLYITTMLKLVYIAHGWTLALLDRPLIMSTIEAWRYGPVIPVLYDAFAKQANVEVVIRRHARLPARVEKEMDEKDVSVISQGSIRDS